jgi:DNA sulfur modification protein DndD
VIIEQVILHNWQPYYGMGSKNCTKFDFRPLKSKSPNSGILYGENTQGKSSFWEAIRFAMYGTVPITDSTNKPLISFELSERPLLNTEAYEGGDYVFMVMILFTHKGTEYSLTRGYDRKKTVSMPRKDHEMEETLTIQNLSKGGTLVQDPQRFINEILPENLANFFMFDGERIEDYKNLLWDVDEIVLVDDIEKILRLTMFSDGIDTCQKIAKSVNREISGHETLQIKDKKRLDAISDKKKEWDGLTSEFDKEEKELLKLQTEEKVLKKWLDGEDKAQKANQIIEDRTKRIKQIDREITEETQTRAKLMQKSWTAIIKKTVETQIKSIRIILDRQEKEGDTIQEHKERIKHLKALLAGEKCGACGTQLKIPPKQLQDEYRREINECESEITKLGHNKLSPDPYDLMRQERELTKLLISNDLSEVKNISKRITNLQEEKRIKIGERDAAVKQTDSTKRDEVAKKQQERVDLLKSIGLKEAEVKMLKELTEDTGREYASLTSGGSVGSGGLTVAHKKANTKKELLEGLSELLEHTKLPFREKMRKQVEKYATAVFLRCTNMRASYKGLRIGKNFKIDIITKSGKTDAGSKGQFALVAYSMLDALTRCSSIEFPFVIDTPSRSLDPDNMERVFDHIFNSNRQVICLPRGDELDPDEGDKKYAPFVAATYSLHNSPHKNYSRSTRKERYRRT